MGEQKVSMNILFSLPLPLVLSGYLLVAIECDSKYPQSVLVRSTNLESGWFLLFSLKGAGKRAYEEIEV